MADRDVSANEEEEVWGRHAQLASIIHKSVGELCRDSKWTRWECCLALNVVSSQCLWDSAQAVGDKSNTLCDASLSQFTSLVDQVRKLSDKKRNNDGTKQ